MKTVCHKPKYFSTYGKKEFWFGFNGGKITSDGGSMLVAGAIKKLKLSESIANCLTEKRDSAKIRHSLYELIEQRLMLMVLGYEDCNDSNHLRNDPMIKSALGRLPETGKQLGSQSTLSRFENSVSPRDIVRMRKLLLRQYIDSVRKSGRKKVILDIDTTDDETHGDQECSLFNGYYQETCYSELLVFDGDTGELITAKLRPGNIHTSVNSVAAIHQIVKELRKVSPEIEIIIRGDSGFGIPGMMDYCENNGIYYILGMKSNKRLERKSLKLSRRAKSRYSKLLKPVLYFGHYKYKAEKWPHFRNGFAKVECGPSGLNTRYVITNMEIKSPKAGYIFYGKRGQMENFIKETKNGMYSDRLSCHRFTANYFRLMITAFAYVVMQEIRKQLKGTDLEKAESSTIRLKLFKVGGQVIESVRKVWIRFSSSFVNAEIFLKAYAGLST